MSHSPPHSSSATHSPPSSPSRVVEFLSSLWFTVHSTVTSVLLFVWGYFAGRLLEHNAEDLESSDEFFDVESLLSSSSDDFFDSLSHLSEEEEFFYASEAFSIPLEDRTARPEAAAQPQEAVVEIKHFPGGIISFAVVYVIIFMIIMYINDCAKHTFPTDACFPRMFGRFSFQPIDQNPLFGPSRATLIKMGGLYLKNVLHMHQAWRIFSSIWLHEGLTQLLTDIVTVLSVGIPLERKFGFVRVGLLYFISGFGGSLFSGLFLRTSVVVGASGALAGLTAGTLSDIVIEYWTLHLDKGFDSIVATGIMFFNIAMTIVQHGDNFANIGGSIFGIALGFVIFSRPPVNRLRCTAICIIIIVGLLTGLMMLLKGIDLNKHCLWCHYLDCIPFPGWSCKYRGIDCEPGEIDTEAGTMLSLTCKGNGRTAQYPLVNSKPPNSIEELCYQLCQ